MKIAITADTHLKNRNNTLDRFEIFEEMLHILQQREIHNLIIAGDTFDKEQQNYNDFNLLMQQYKKIHVTIIPGNHDVEIAQKFFPLENLTVIEQPEIKTFDAREFVFFPYKAGATFDETIAEFAHQNQLPKKWILVGHGDYLDRRRIENPYESGMYMPLTYRALETFKPSRVFLGHIHAPSPLEGIIYPGSPCPLDINETGKRRFIIYDTASDEIESIEIPKGNIYMKETIFAIPMENEKELILMQIDNIIKGWKLTREELDRVLLRLSVKGFSNNLNELKNTINEKIRQIKIKWYDADGANISDVRVISHLDYDRNAIFTKVQEKIETLPFSSVASKEQILLKTLEIIYGDTR
ncbi:MAG: metallophosphoesterase family protein [Spirochaetes bacterium]|nr:metallophosphoesterase family protein [Spirochaetota bacterium]